MLVLIGTAQTSTGTLEAGGYVVLLFAALGVYIYFGTAAQATGGKAVRLGQPVLRG